MWDRVRYLSHIHLRQADRKRLEVRCSSTVYLTWDVPQAKLPDFLCTNNEYLFTVYLVYILVEIISITRLSIYPEANNES